MKRIIKFPSVSTADENGLVAIGGDFEVDTLLQAYRQGIFPWPISADFPVAWFSPDPRGVIDLEKVHYPSSFLKWKKKQNYKITVNQHFDEVINGCKNIKRNNQSSTWITSELIHGYKKFHNEGRAFSIEISIETKIIAGLFGVNIGEYVSGESMFTKEKNGSKLALFTLLEVLKKNNIRFLDTQMVTTVVESFGGMMLKRADFIRYLDQLNWEKKIIWEI